jgi:ParB-like chromosome segregation protein Spo0J
LADRGDLAFQDPLMVTADGIILDGFARWSLARLRGRTMLPCIIRDLDEAEALVYILQKQRQSAGLNDFIRVSLALELEPNFRAQARERQRVGGEKKGSSNLTGAQRIDVRAQIAQTAGVCVANVTKAKNLIGSADASVLTALKVGEIRIHRAWTWLESSKDGGLQAYKNFRNETGMRRKVKTLIAAQVGRRPAATDDLNELRRALSELSSKPRFEGLVRSMDGILQAFESQMVNKPVHNVAA